MKLLFACVPLRQTTTGTLYLYVNLLFTSARVPVLWNVNVLWEERQEKQRIIRQDAKEMHGIGRGRGGHAAWGAGGGLNQNVKTFFFAVFRNLLLRVFFSGHVTEEQNNWISGVGTATSVLEGQRWWTEPWIIHNFGCTWGRARLLTSVVPNKFLVLVFVLLLALGVCASRLL